MNAKEVTIGLAIVFAGITLTLGVVSVLVTPVAALVAIPFAVAAYLLWGHAVVHLDAYRIAEDRRRTRAAMDDRIGDRWPRWPPGTEGATTEASGATGTETATDGSAWTDAGAGYRRRTFTRGRATDGAGSGYRRRTGSGQHRAAPRESALSVDAARRILDVEAGADQEAIRQAYRDGVKETHPDQGGDEETFRELRQAYEVLRR